MGRKKGTDWNLVRVLIDTLFGFSRVSKIKGQIFSSTRFDISRNGMIAFGGIDGQSVGNSGLMRDFAVIDSNDNIIISKQIGNGIFQQPELNPLKLGLDEKSLTLQVSNYPAMDSMVRVDIPLYGDSSLYSCLGKDTVFFTTEPAVMQKGDIGPLTIHTGIAYTEDVPITTSDLNLERKEFCKVKSVCNSIILTGNSSFCTGASQTFVARKNAGCLKSINWNTDALPATLMAKTDSSITLQFATAWTGDIIATLNGCELADTINASVTDPGSILDLGPDKVLCSGDSLTLTASPGFINYEWNTGETSPSIKIKQVGTYFVTAEDGCGNNMSDTIQLKAPDKVFPLIGDQLLCMKDSFFVSRLPWFSNYTWEPPAEIIRDTIYVLAPEINTRYLVRAQDEYGCWWNREFVVTVQHCPERIWFPSAFTPDHDGLNDNFGPVVEGRWAFFSFSIYNRWGQMIFSSADPFKKWDGKFKGAYAPTGVYTWVCKYQFPNNTQQMKKWTVVLIR